MTLRLGATPRLSVLIPTHNRATLLRDSLESLHAQRLPKDQFEIVVVDDGSTDDTAGVCDGYRSRLPLTYHRIHHAGISAAKNLAIFVASAPIILFFDDDDIAHPDLLRVHLQVHREHPEEQIAVLGYTTWAPTLEVTALMRYVTEVGHFLFSYTNLTPGQMLDFTYFWGGRTSCKRLFLAQHGIFNQDFHFGCEDIELGYRLSRHGLRVLYRPDAISYMNRPITFDEFCRRCERQGRSQWHFSQLHPDPIVQQWCGVASGRDKTPATTVDLESHVRRVHELENVLSTTLTEQSRASFIKELFEQYRVMFTAFNTLGILQSNNTRDDAMFTDKLSLTAHEFESSCIHSSVTSRGQLGDYRLTDGRSATANLSASLHGDDHGV